MLTILKVTILPPIIILLIGVVTYIGLLILAAIQDYIINSDEENRK